MKAWVLKLRRYTGSESIVRDYDTEEEAQAEADKRNAEYQSDTHYAEPWDPEKYGPWLKKGNDQ
jgi:hypothetical protein